MTAVEQLRDELRLLVECESPSCDLTAISRCAQVVSDLGRQRTGSSAERITVDGRVHLRWTFGAPRILLLGHLDTVWPLGTLSRWPFTVDRDRATGPGAFDMKAGLVQMFDALAAAGDLDGTAVLVTSDEEIGSGTSDQLIQDTATDTMACLVLEPSAGGALKTARKGAGMFHVEVTGRAAHAGLEPENGINATVEAAIHVLTIAALERAEAGTTVTPTVLHAGTTVNTVPATASIAVDVRTRTLSEMRRVEDSLRSLRPKLSGAQVRVTAGSMRPPLEPSASASLFERTRAHAQRLGFGTLPGVEVGGGSDGNLTAAIGVPTLDGLGAVGGNAHAEGEWVSLSAMPKRAAIVAALIRELLDTG
jgi:glutamate carboxypeptidase